MIPKIVLMVLGGGVALIGAVLFSHPDFSKEDTKPIQRVEAVSSAPTPQNTKTLKSQNTSTPLPKLTASLLPETVLLNTSIPTLPTGPLSSITPTPTTAPPFVLQTPAPTLIPAPVAEQSIKININTADKQELEKITGVGPVIAQRIIDYRQTNGPFQKTEDIKKVSGIGDVKFEKMKNEITI